VLEKLYSGTFYRFAAPFPDTLQRPFQLKALIPHKYRKEPLYKVLEAQPSADLI
jgi:hypothetical protein